MTRRKIVKPVVKFSDRLKKYLLIVLQTLFGVLIGLCFFIYNANSRFTIEVLNNSADYVPAFHEFSTDYYDSSVYSDNLYEKIYEILDYGALNGIFATGGIYDADKPVFIGAYVHRNDKDPYTGPDCAYRLEDLLSWGRNRVDVYFSRFKTKKEYDEFFGYETEPKAESESSEENTEASTKDYANFDIVENRFKTVEGKNLEEYAKDDKEYKILTDNLIKATTGLQSDYDKYNKYYNRFNANSTNVRFFLMTDKNGQRNVITNAEGVSRNINEDKITAFFKEYGEYVYIYPSDSKYKFLTNTPIVYENVKAYINDYFGYAYSDEVKLWVAIDTEYGVEDVFKSNYKTFVEMSRLIPWILSLGMVSLIAFFALAVVIIFREKRTYSYEGAAEDLGDFDRLPIEIGVLFFVILVILLFLGNMLIVKNVVGQGGDFTTAVVPLSIMLAIDLFVSLLFFYGFARRVICKNLFKGSIASMLYPFFSKIFGKVYRKFWRAYDSAGVAVRTWSAYVFFLIFNVFFGSMLIFGRFAWVAMIALAVFDLSVGIILYRRSMERKKIVDGIRKINDGDYEYQIEDKKMHGDNKEFADAVNNIGQGIKTAVEMNIKDEKMKADLITNVSHDIKTPLTSLINYVDLLKRENIDNPKASKYIAILDEKSQRLKQLTFDLVEASKITSGNINLDMSEIDFVELLNQAVGEFEERFDERKLEVIKTIQGSTAHIMADPARMWRIIENLFNNVYKYALEDTRVYIDLATLVAGETRSVTMSVKNISTQQLNIPADELTERFIRGDVSRSTEGTGLGLSIAKSLTIAMGGTFEIYLDGDLFKVMITFPRMD
ncbi:MAG: HAMP domain-containing histidine kinase [Lachnospiraceae bacterium]|nr:HAMP domain-containing histidine kinase [Lachnospiraceae bacterium]